MKKDQELARFLLSSHFKIIIFKLVSAMRSSVTMHGLSANSSF